MEIMKNKKFIIDLRKSNIVICISIIKLISNMHKIYGKHIGKTRIENKNTNTDK